MGMVPAVSPAFLNLSDGSVVGVPTAATRENGLRIMARPPRKPAVLAPDPIVHEEVADTGAGRRGSERGDRDDGRKRDKRPQRLTTDACPSGHARPPPGDLEPVTSAPSRRRRNRRGSPMLRLRVGFVVIAMVLSFFGARLVQLQAIDPESYAEMAAAEGSVEVVLPAERGEILDRNGVPLAGSIEGVMVVADPLWTEPDAKPLAQLLATRLGIDYFATLQALRADSRFEYVARRVPSTAGDRRPRRGRGGRLQGALHPARPRPRLPGPRRRGQPGRLPGHARPRGGRAAAGRLRARLQQAALRHRRLRALPGERRQPDPARRQHHREGRRRPGPAHHHRPRPPVVRPARAPPDRRGRPGRVRHRDRDGLAHRRAAGARRPPDVRRHQAARRAARRPRLARDERRLRAGLGREGADDVVADRRRQGHAHAPSCACRRGSSARTARSRTGSRTTRST